MSLTVRRSGCLLLLLAAGSCSRDDRADLSAATSELHRAIRDEDIPTFLSKFSDTGTWTMLSTHAVVPADLEMTRAELARELEARAQIHSYIFGPRPWALRAFTVPPHDEPWQPIDALRFGPADVRRGEVAVAWRQEGTKWVVDALAWPIQ